jgi:hypothetical protein
MFGMVLDPVVSLLAKQPTSSLRAMQDEARQHIESLRLQYELLTRAIEARQASGSSDTQAAGGRVPRGTKRAIFREILGTRPEHPWMPAEVRTALAMQGIESSSASIRVMLRRMVEDGEVERGNDGNGWKLASSNDADSQGSPEEPTSWSVPGGMGG